LQPNESRVSTVANAIVMFRMTTMVNGSAGSDQRDENGKPSGIVGNVVGMRCIVITR
jgi:hypothetical protein